MKVIEHFRKTQRTDWPAFPAYGYLHTRLAWDAAANAHLLANLGYAALVQEIHASLESISLPSKLVGDGAT